MTGVMIWRSTSVSSNEDVPVFLCNLGNMRTETHICSAFRQYPVNLSIGVERTDSRPNISTEDGLDGKVWIDFANDEGSVAIGEMSFLFNVRTATSKMS